MELKTADLLAEIEALRARLRATEPAEVGGQRAAETSGALAEVGRLLSETLDPEVVAQRIVDSVRTLLGSRASAVYRVKLESGDLVALAVSGEVGPTFGRGAVFPQGMGVVGLAVRDRRPVATANVLTDPRVELTPDVRARIEQTLYRAVLAVPLLVQDRVIGVLGIGDREGRVFRGEEIRLAQAFTDQAALALENARLYEDVSAARDFLRSIAESSADAIVAMDLNGVITYWSPGAEDMFGYRAEEAVGRPVADFVPGGTEEAGRVMRRLTVEGRVRDYETTIRAKDGQGVVVNTSLGPLRTATGAIAGMVSISKDLTKRKQAEHALKASEARYRGLVAGSIQGIWIHIDFIMQFANSAMARILGYEEPEELIGLDIRQFIAPEDRARVEGDQKPPLPGEVAPIRHDYQALRRDGKRIWVELAETVVPWDDQRAILATLSDITERKHLEAQLRQAQKMEELGKLAGGIAHDFNNLLTVIKGRSEFLLRGPGPEGAQRRHVELINRTADRAAGLTRQLLAFARKQVLQPRVLDLGGVIRNLDEMLRRLLGEDITVATIVDPAVGRVKVDPGQLEQVIVNLAVNGRDAMPSGGPLTIEARNVELDEAFSRLHPDAHSGPYVMLAVGDTGVGMDAETQAHIFEPFFTTKGLGKGAGLGLATVYGIVKQHEGYIALESAPGRGTTFRIYLPRVEESAETVEATATAPNEPSTGKETVLLVEDEADVRALACEILRLSGYNVLEAARPGDALEMCERHEGPIHLLVTDVVMPEMNGPELAERLGALRPDAKVLFMSGYTDETLLRHRAVDAGTPLLPKPFTPESLARRVREVLDVPEGQ